MRRDRAPLLLAAALVLLALWAFCWKALGEGWGMAALLLSLHGLALFCLQLFLCHTLRRRWLKLLPALLLVGFAAWVLWGMAHDHSGGWDRLIGGAILWFCAAPAGGGALAWGAYGIWTYRRKNHEQEL